MGNLQVRFLEGWGSAMAPGYSNEKASVSQDSFVLTLLSSRAASVATLPSAVFYERFSLAARWASSIQRVLLPDYRPWLRSLRPELGQELGAVT
jgi:hypothetical protein